VVAARLKLFDLAQRAYGEALDLDAAIGEAQRDVGIVRLERRRWARALEELADEAALDPPAGPGADRPDRDPDAPAGDPDVSAGLPHRDPTAPGRLPRREPGASRPRRPAEPAVPGLPVVSRPAGPVLDPSEDSARSLSQAARYGAGGSLVAALSTAAMSDASSGASRVWAGMIGVLLLVSVPIWLARRLTEPLSAALGRLRARDRPRAAAVYAVLVAPAFIVLYAVIGGLTPLIAAGVVAAAAVVLAGARPGKQRRS
jgi:hypothetical protein